MRNLLLFGAAICIIGLVIRGGCWRQGVLVFIFRSIILVLVILSFSPINFVYFIQVTFLNIFLFELVFYINKNSWHFENVPAWLVGLSIKIVFVKLIRPLASWLDLFQAFFINLLGDCILGFLLKLSQLQLLCLLVPNWLTRHLTFFLFTIPNVFTHI